MAELLLGLPLTGALRADRLPRPSAPRRRRHAAERYFTAANAERYRAAATERGIAELGVAEHVYRFPQALDVWHHPFWRENAHDDLDAYCALRARGDRPAARASRRTSSPAREDRMAKLLEAREWDYVVGSIHFLADGALD